MKKIKKETRFYFPKKLSIYKKVKAILKKFGYEGFPIGRQNWKKDFDVGIRERIETIRGQKIYLYEELITFRMLTDDFSIDHFYLDAKNEYKLDEFPDYITILMHKLEDAIRQRKKRTYFYMSVTDRRALDFLKKRLGKSKSKIIREAIWEKLAMENLDMEFIEEREIQRKYGYEPTLEPTIK